VQSLTDIYLFVPYFRFCILLFLYFTVSILYCSVLCCNVPCMYYCTVLYCTVRTISKSFILFFDFILFKAVFTVMYYVLFSCTTRNLWDLWWFGNPVKNMAPYRTHTSMEYVPKKFLSYLSRARKVMEKIESLLKAKGENSNLSRENITDSRTMCLE
jgi:hypothetical protein